MQVSEQVKRAVEHASLVEPTQMMDEELPRVEALLPKVQPQTEDWRLVMRALTAMYQQALMMVAAAAKAMGYPPEIGKWPGTEPLEAVAELHPVLWGTDWYQRMLGQVVNPVKHPWYTPPMEI